MATTARRASASASSMAPSTSSLELLRVGRQAGHLREAALLELRVPQVLRQAVVDLARQPGTLLERGGDELGCGQAAHLHGRRAQVGADRRDARSRPRPSSSAVEGQPQQVADGHQAGVAAGVDGAVHLAEGGDQQAGREQGIPRPTAAAVGPMRQQRRDEEAGADQALDDDQDRGGGPA